MGCIGVEGVLALLAPVLQGCILPSCAVGVVGYGLVTEDERVVVPHAVAPSPNAHGREVFAQCAGVTCGGMVYMASAEADGHLSTCYCRGAINQHFALGAATDEQCTDAKQICRPVFLHVFFVSCVAENLF